MSKQLRGEREFAQSKGLGSNITSLVFSISNILLAAPPKPSNKVFGQLTIFVEINSEEDEKPVMVPVYEMLWMGCVCNGFKDFGKFKFANQNETKILLVEFKVKLPFRRYN